MKWGPGADGPDQSRRYRCDKRTERFSPVAVTLLEFFNFMTELRLNSETSIYLRQAAKTGIFIQITSSKLGTISTFMTVSQAKQLIRDIEFGIKR